jgi:hypothetical protein
MPADRAALDVLHDVAGQLVGQPVLWHISDDRYGAAIDLGDRQKRARPTPNPTLSEDQQNYRGTQSIFISCRCDLDVPDDFPDRPPSTNDYGFLDLVVGRRPLSVEIDPSTLKMRVGFEDGLTLTVEARRDPYYYRLSSLNTYVTVRHGGRVDVADSNNEL